MTTNDELLAKGRLLVDYAAAKTKVGTLRAETHRLGKVFSALGHVLETAPEHVRVQRQALGATYAPHAVDLDEAWPDAAAVADLGDALREALDTLERHSTRLKEMGVL